MLQKKKFDKEFYFRRNQNKCKSRYFLCRWLLVVQLRNCDIEMSIPTQFILCHRLQEHKLAPGEKNFHKFVFYY